MAAEVEQMQAVQMLVLKADVVPVLSELQSVYVC